MDYIFHGDSQSLPKMITTFQAVCQKRGFRMDKIRATLILLAFIDDAKEQGLIEEIPVQAEGVRS